MGCGGGEGEACGGLANRGGNGGLQRDWERLHLPIKDVAFEFGVSLSFFKKQCRALGVRRWPSRKLSSLARVRKALEGDGCGGGDEAAQKELLSLLDQNVEDIMEDPDAPIYDEFIKCRHEQYRVQMVAAAAAGGGGGGVDSGGADSDDGCDSRGTTASGGCSGASSRRAVAAANAVSTGGALTGQRRCRCSRRRRSDDGSGAEPERDDPDSDAS
ncbi:hypothetical protein GPECTOR_580g633 [Gonium pectorale]|uniref:RWP-RK domain-containing protein n=1 Tax=Gonium pectorale TaxID=33097 RepID=A0A150FUG9_GONPE|nr:hypothetical protein GPECTOR_580g633 [Gonium pectorale]|eukprot:KXZ41283.1 hypothetical protein GPECTOR_580g633 [Gonium pectorale]